MQEIRKLTLGQALYLPRLPLLRHSFQIDSTQTRSISNHLWGLGVKRLEEQARQFKKLHLHQRWSAHESRLFVCFL